MSTHNETDQIHDEKSAEFQERFKREVEPVKRSIMELFPPGKHTLDSRVISDGVQESQPGILGIYVTSALTELIREGKLSISTIPDERFCGVLTFAKSS